MATYSQNDVTVKPPGEFTIKPEHWASTYESRPAVAMPVGIRLLSDSDLTYVQSLVKSDDDKRGLITMAVSRAICDPDDATKAHESFEFPDQQVPLALRPETIQAIFDELERLMIATSPLYPEASEEEVLALVTAIADGELDRLLEKDNARGKRALRLLKFCLDELG